MSDAEKVFRLQNVNCMSGSQYLLRDINWEVPTGEHWVVFGKNGCGKTTLLSIVAGYQRFTEGTMEVFGQQYRPDNILELRKQIGFISGSFFEKYYRNERVLDIILAGLGGTLGLPYAITEKEVGVAKDLLNALGLKTKTMAPFYLLSKGERQQVLIIRELLKKPKLLILDEPCVGLDVLARERFLMLLEQYSLQKDRTMIYVTHYPEEILPVFQKSLLLRSGMIYRQGDMKELFTSDVMSDFLSFPVSVELQKDQRYGFHVEDTKGALIPDSLMEVLV